MKTRESLKNMETAKTRCDEHSKRLQMLSKN